MAHNGRQARWRFYATGALTLAVVTGCTGGPSQSAQATAAPPAVQIGPENVVKVESGIVIVGPLLSGELRPEREAAIRAEIGGSIVQVTVEEGETVRKGALLGRIETRTLDEARQSAVSALTSVENQLAVARRESERTEQLVTAGALAARDLDLAKSNVTGAEAQLADARSRLASADRQLSDTIVRSPMAGIVADRAVNAGDVVSPGTALFTVIDPSSMRFEASVPSENVSDLRVGAAVQFEVRGYQTAFTGRIQRIGPQADPSRDRYRSSSRSRTSKASSSPASSPKAESRVPRPQA